MVLSKYTQYELLELWKHWYWPQSVTTAKMYRFTGPITNGYLFNTYQSTEDKIILHCSMNNCPYYYTWMELTHIISYSTSQEIFTPFTAFCCGLIQIVYRYLSGLFNRSTAITTSSLCLWNIPKPYGEIHLINPQSDTIQQKQNTKFHAPVIRDLL